MNKIISILICCFIAGCLFVSCEQPDIPDVPNYDKTEILTFKVYNQDKEEVGIEFLKLVLEVLAHASAQAIYVPGYKPHFFIVYS